ncbi:OmpA family protein [Candidatus Chordibacter forsetii]|uniref:OmpA family protein n=1 Tax=Candidatus Chordibacter forsetii TaxID=3381758 RepID=UPI00389B1F5D
MLRFPGLFGLALLLAWSAGCSRTAVPKSELSRSAPVGDLSGMILDRGIEQNLVSPVGQPVAGLLGTPDLLQPRNPEHELFSDPGNSIRPFEAVYFDFDQFNLSPEERGKVIELAGFLAENRDARLLIEGYCDWKGTPAYNKSLGERRANTIMQYLVELGADPRRIDTLSIGDEAAIPQALENQTRLDRRAEFVIYKGN